MGRWPRSASLLGVFILLLLVYPWTLGSLWAQSTFELVATTITVMTSLYVAGRAHRRTGAGLLVLLLILAVPAYFWANRTLLLVMLLTTLCIYVFVAVTLLVSFMSHRVVTSDTLCSALAVYLLVGTSFALLFSVLEICLPGSLGGQLHPGPMGDFRFDDLLYFSYCTLTTVGYGDILPVSPGARSLSVLEQMCGVFYSGVLIARLVGLYQANALLKGEDSE